MFEISFFALLGFFFAAYAVVGNDALQTLGTFINSNSKLDWKWLFLFAGAVLVVTFTYGWIIYDGDPSWQRLANTKKYPPVDIKWYHTLPPLALVVITRFGVPVSTSFMVLTVFAAVDGFTSMLGKSLTGYGLAFAVGLLVYLVLTKSLEKYFQETPLNEHAPFGLATIAGIIIGLGVYFIPPLISPDFAYGFNVIRNLAIFGIVIDIIAFFAVKKFGRQAYWIILQWVTTGYLWGVWLIQDFANIFVFLPRELTPLEGFSAMFIILALLGYTFWNQGGPVQKILRSKTSVTDIRSATLIDFTYASLLFFFKEVSDIPMSTTFVFLGLIAGREFGFSLMRKDLSVAKAWMLSLSDASKAYIGLVISINMAVGLPRISQYMTGEAVNPISSPFMTFVIIANLMLLPVAFFLMKQDDRARKIINTIALGSAAIAFFTFPIS